MTETFGDALRRLRNERRVSLRALQTLTQYSHGYISELERGVKKPTPFLAKRLDEALDGKGLLTALASAATIGLVREADRTQNDGADEVPIKEFAMTAEESARFI